jgi:hypothetical protein
MASPQSPLLPLAWRATVLYAVVRPLFAVASHLAESEGGSADHPLGIVVLVTILGAVDIRRRGEVLFWGNLGFPPVVTSGVFALVALAAEVVLVSLA